MKRGYGKQVIVSREGGMSLIGVIFWIVILAMVVALIVKVMPVYYENLSLQHIVQQQVQATTPEESLDRVRRDLNDRLAVAMIEIPQQDIFISRNGSSGPVQIRVDYEREVPLFANVSLLIHFDTRA
ncbi:DUF4845 domain-containing protein [Acidithiobacillus caldus]|jgi:hypothetical protein|nr:DUF4845 domain-containing protein [Acidithiobacillus caldus]MBU2728438.1 DUF4845 domain-containing protein [Acidithiobacillus caldus]MBU2737119.1 DUF4845 domain-containing protein [Acidithiobacillus caldus ATCC 51756]MBU2744920.1 DUF4845 domain-containing protein [Acidithiobacillus caldus]MBU2779378.1 DUF4845 domain-containing protein [Acidithiobacillus caldus]